MDLAPLARAVEVLTSPLGWGGQDAWVAECLRRVREFRGLPAPSASTDALADLEQALRPAGDEPAWLQAALPGLRSALAAGLAAHRRLAECGTTLGQAFEGMDTGMAIFRCDGPVPVTRNGRWDELLRQEPDRDALLELVAQAGRAAASSGGQGEGDEVELSGRTYRLVASRTAAGTLLPEPAVLVLLERLGPELPTTQELRIAFGLRGREPQVALLAAQGLSNADIARRLRLSAHTVRHYLERVLDRLGLHTRKALALRLMASNGERRD